MVVAAMSGRPSKRKRRKERRIVQIPKALIAPVMVWFEVTMAEIADDPRERRAHYAREEAWRRHLPERAR